MNFSEKREIAEAFKDSTDTYADIGGTVKRWRTGDWDQAVDIVGMQVLIGDVSRSTGLLFSLGVDRHTKRTRIQPTRLGQRILTSLKINPDNVIRHFPHHQLNPFIDLFFEQAANRDLFRPHLLTERLSEERMVQLLRDLNDFVQAVRAEAGSETFKKKIAGFERSANKNFKSVVKFIDAHFAIRSRLLILRVDFSYRKPKAWPVCNAVAAVDYAEVKAHRKLLVKHLKHSLPDKFFVDYVLKLEYGLEKGWHYHCLILLDGAQARQEVIIAKRLGEHWEKVITQGRGLYWNCNGDKRGYKSCGIGMISHDDTAAREGLVKAIHYLTKIDFFAQLQVPGNDRTFWKGCLPKPKTSQVGRPRTLTKKESTK